MIDQIKPGFTLFITSYLGDADYYNTEVITGLDRQQARLVERFVRGCISPWEEKSIYNEDERIDISKVKEQFALGEIECLLNAVYPGAVLNSFEDSQVAEALSDLTYDILGTACEYTSSLRCFSGLKVAYFSDHQDLTCSVD